MTRCEECNDSVVIYRRGMCKACYSSVVGYNTMVNEERNKKRTVGDIRESRYKINADGKITIVGKVTKDYNVIMYEDNNA